MLRRKLSNCITAVRPAPSANLTCRTNGEILSAMGKLDEEWQYHAPGHAHP